MTPTAPLAARLVATLEATWELIRFHHADLPVAVLRLGQGHDPRHPGRSIRGHWAPCTWAFGDDHIGEVMLAGERLQDGAGSVLSTLLHEAAHGLAHARSVADTSRQGRYHNRRFREIGEEVLLDVARSGRFGWSVTELSAAARERYREPLDELTGVLSIYRRRFSETTSQRKTRRRPSRLKLVCGCGRALYMAPGVAARGPVVCRCCEESFLPV